MSHTIYQPFAKIGHSLGNESLRVEFPLALMTVYQSGVLDVFEQPPLVDFSDTTDDGRVFNVRYTPDFLVLKSDGVEILEGTLSAEFSQMCMKTPNVWQADPATGAYHSKPIAKYFGRWNFRFHAFSEHNLKNRFVRALRFLKPYIDGFPIKPIAAAEQEMFIKFAQMRPGAKLGELEFPDSARRIEVACYLLTRARIFTSWSDLDVEDPQSLRIYPTPQDEDAYYQYLEGTRPHPKNLDELGYRLQQGSLVEIGSKTYEVAGLSSKHVRLRDDETGEYRELAHQTLLDLKSRIGAIHHADKTFETMYQEAPMEHRATWAMRKAAIKPYLPNGPKANDCPSDRTIRRMRDAFLRNEANGLPGDEAIFPKYFRCGRPPRTWKPEISAEIDSVLEKHHLNPKKCSITWAWKQIRAKFHKSDIPSERTLARLVSRINRHKKDWCQLGKRGALRSQPFFGDDPILGSPHGHRSWQRAHIDSSPLDLSMDGSPRQWLTKMVDSFDNRVLAFVISDDRPTGLTIRKLLLACVKAHGRLPSEIVCDRGSEHRWGWVKITLASINVLLDFRPTADPRKGGPVEFSLGTLIKELIHNMEGNTKLLKKARLVTKAVDPKQFAIWTPAELFAVLEEYFYLRNELPQREKPSPNSIAIACDRKWGPIPRQVASVEEYGLLLLPLVSRKGVRRVSQRGTIKSGKDIFGIRGIQNELIKYAGKDVLVRYVPEDPDTMYAFPRGKRCAIKLIRLTCVGLTQDLVDSATTIDIGTASAAAVADCNEQRVAEFAAKVVKTEARLSEEKETSSKVVKFEPPPEDQSDDDLPLLEIY
jgi:putative transposase